MQYVVVTVDYFTKWVEIEELAAITPVKIKEFIYKNIVCRYGVPTPSYMTMEHSSTVMNSMSFVMTSRSRRSSHQSHNLRPIGRSQL